MNLGINEVNQKLYCANCKKNISNLNETMDNYCSSCGAPLSQNAIKEFEEREYNVKRDVLRRLNQIAKDNSLTNLEDVIEIYADEIE